MPVEQRKGIAAIFADIIGWLKHPTLGTQAEETLDRHNPVGNVPNAPKEGEPYSVIEDYLCGLDGRKKKGDAFEALAKFYLENHPDWAGKFRKVTAFTEWSGRWGEIDKGVDIIAETIDGSFWAIQYWIYW